MNEPRTTETTKRREDVSLQFLKIHGLHLRGGLGRSRNTVFEPKRNGDRMVSRNVDECSTTAIETVM